VSRSRYRRAFTLSKELDADKVSAELAQGVLRVRIPKAEHAQPRKITVNVS
jgi:HSP20 family molecular chaperone IbpA